MNTFTIYVENNELYEQYQERAKSHNENCNTSLHYDAGFDILTPQEIDCPPLCATKLNSNIVATLYDCNENPLSFYMYARSSISKTPLRLANNVGIIDSGYRGNLIGAFDNIRDDTYIIEKYNRLLQICAPNLSKFLVEVKKVDDFKLLHESTNRGAGGFGSTGK